MQEKLTLRTIHQEDLPELWAVSYGPKADLQWMKWDGPYFQDPVMSWEAFSEGFGKTSIENPMRRVICWDGKIVGIATAYWEDGSLKKWLEFGVAIYDATLWNKGIGSQAMAEWVTYLFELEKHLQRIGYTTWSGNHRMMRVGEKLGFQKEAQIRKVRFWQGKYYDSIKYGILREEWSALGRL